VTCHLPVVDRSQIAGARQRATAAAEGAGFNETDAHRAGIVATELASNLVKHATHGGEQGVLRFAVGLPATAGNELTDDYVKLSLYVDAEQVH